MKSYPYMVLLYIEADVNQTCDGNFYFNIVLETLQSKSCNLIKTVFKNIVASVDKPFKHLL